MRGQTLKEARGLMSTWLRDTSPPVSTENNWLLLYGCSILVVGGVLAWRLILQNDFVTAICHAF